MGHYDPQNCRLINQTPVLAKIMDSIVKDQLIIFLTNNELIGEFQHDFLKHRPCTPCHLDLVTLNVVDKKVIIMIFLDMPKPFVCFPRERLLSKINSYSLADPPYPWLASYLSGRSQVVIIKGILSQP